MKGHWAHFIWREVLGFHKKFADHSSRSPATSILAEGWRDHHFMPTHNWANRTPDNGLYNHMSYSTFALGENKFQEWCNYLQLCLIPLMTAQFDNLGRKSQVSFKMMWYCPAVSRGLGTERKLQGVTTTVFGSFLETVKGKADIKTLSEVRDIKEQVCKCQSYRRRDRALGPYCLLPLPPEACHSGGSLDLVFLSPSHQ